MRNIPESQEEVACVCTTFNDFLERFLIAIVLIYKRIWPHVGGLDAGGIDYPEVYNPTQPFFQVFQDCGQINWIFQVFVGVLMGYQIQHGLTFIKEI